MNALTLVGIACIVLVAAYLLYGRWLVKTWGIDPKAQTPAYRHQSEGGDFAPASCFTVFSHQFCSITGAGPVTGPIIAAMFGWLPAFLWLLLGGVFFGAVQDFVALYASVKSEGKSMGEMIEHYVGRAGRKLFLLYSWLFTILVIAAFSDIIAGTFNGFSSVVGENGVEQVVQIVPNAAAASISMIYIFVAIVFGFFIRMCKPNEWLKLAVGIAMLVGMLYAGIKYPMFYSMATWRNVVFAYCFIVAVMPMWLLMQPRDYLSVFLLLGMIFCGAIGLLLTNPSINMPAVVGYTVNNQYLFPALFITIACGAVSGFHSLVSSGTSSKTIANEAHMLPVGYGSMLIETLLGVVSLVIACSAAQGGVLPKGTPFQIFAGAVGKFFAMFGLPEHAAACIMTMCVSALGMTTIDTVARIARMSIQEFFKSADGKFEGVLGKLFANDYIATGVTLVLGYILCLAGYSNIWPLFGAANQLLSAMVLISMAVFMRVTKRKGWMLYIPMTFMFVVTITSLVMSIMGIYNSIAAGKFVFMVGGLQMIIAVLLIALAVTVALHCLKKLTSSKEKAVA